MREITIEWEGPRFLWEVLKLNKWDDSGLYQICRRDNISKTETLCYIGKAEGDTFKSRIHDYHTIEQCRTMKSHQVEEIYIRIGRITPDSYQDDADWKQVLKDAKALLIYHHYQKNDDSYQEFNKQAKHSQLQRATP